jgi:hypothetical protein
VDVDERNTTMFTPEGGLNEELMLAIQIERELETEDLVVLGRLRKAMREAHNAEVAAARGDRKTQAVPAAAAR